MKKLESFPIIIIKYNLKYALTKDKIMKAKFQYGVEDQADSDIHKNMDLPEERKKIIKKIQIQQIIDNRIMLRKEQLTTILRHLKNIIYKEMLEESIREIDKLKEENETKWKKSIEDYAKNEEKIIESLMESRKAAAELDKFSDEELQKMYDHERKLIYNLYNEYNSSKNNFNALIQAQEEEENNFDPDIERHKQEKEKWKAEKDKHPIGSKERKECARKEGEARMEENFTTQTKVDSEFYDIPGKRKNIREIRAKIEALQTKINEIEKDSSLSNKEKVLIAMQTNKSLQDKIHELAKAEKIFLEYTQLINRRKARMRQVQASTSAGLVSNMVDKLDKKKANTITSEEKDKTKLESKKPAKINFESNLQEVFTLPLVPGVNNKEIKPKHKQILENSINKITEQTVNPFAIGKFDTKSIDVMKSTLKKNYKEDSLDSPVFQKKLNDNKIKNLQAQMEKDDLVKKIYLNAKKLTQENTALVKKIKTYADINNVVEIVAKKCNEFEHNNLNIYTQCEELFEKIKNYKEEEHKMKNDFERVQKASLKKDLKNAPRISPKSGKM